MKSMSFDDKPSKGKSTKGTLVDAIDLSGLLGLLIVGAIIYWLTGSASRNTGVTLPTPPVENKRVTDPPPASR